MSLLEIKNLTVEFQTATGPFRAVDGVSLKVDEGEVLAIVGESGSGKSVSMLAAMGLLPWTAKVTADVLTFNGRDMQAMSGVAREVEAEGRRANVQPCDITDDASVAAAVANGRSALGGRLDGLACIAGTTGPTGSARRRRSAQ